MKSIMPAMRTFQDQLQAGSIQDAYRTLIDFMNRLRSRFARQYGDSAVSGLYQGFMDMTYFAVFTPLLKQHDLKIAVVFHYAAFRFEAWLSARNRKVQALTWKVFSRGAWPAYRVVSPEKGIDSILECDLAANPDFDHPEELASKLEKGCRNFLEDIEKYLSTHQQGEVK